MDCRICGDPNSAMRFAFIEFAEDAAAHTVRGGRRAHCSPRALCFAWAHAAGACTFAAHAAGACGACEACMALARTQLARP